MMRLLYTILLSLVSPFLVYSLYKKKHGNPPYGTRWKEHFGVTPKLSHDTKPIWIHAVSVGECLAVIPLIRAIKLDSPTQHIVVTTTTSTGAEQITKLGNLVEHRYMPIDFSFAVRGFLKAIKPSQLLIVETELWPNTLVTVHKAGIPITVINARLSEKSCNAYARIKPLFNLIHPCITQVLCQSQSDANRFAQLGIRKDKLNITGSIKFDIDVSDGIKEKSRNLRNRLGSNRPVWIAASTHKGEDEQILKAHEAILTSHPTSLLILVPRHPERFNDVYELCQSLKFNTVTRTSSQTVTEATQVYLGNTMGEMLTLLGASDLCFMGGSLIGDKVGGHNILEPAALGIPVITGPSYFNFKEIVNTLKKDDAIFICHSSLDLSETIINLFSNTRISQDIKIKLQSFIQKNSGAIKNTLKLIHY